MRRDVAVNVNGRCYKRHRGIRVRLGCVASSRLPSSNNLVLMMSVRSWSNPHLRLEIHPTARNQALAVRAITPGTTVVTVAVLSFVLLPEEKSQRCDACCIRGGETVNLKRCSGCASYWYCSPDCELDFHLIGFTVRIFMKQARRITGKQSTS